MSFNWNMGNPGIPKEPFVMLSVVVVLLSFLITIPAAQCMIHNIDLVKPWSTFGKYRWHKLPNPTNNIEHRTDKVVRMKYVSTKAGSYSIVIKQLKDTSVPSSSKTYSVTIELKEGFHHVDISLIIFNGFDTKYKYSLGLPNFIEIWDMTVIDSSSLVVHVLVERDFYQRRKVLRRFIEGKRPFYRNFNLIVDRGRILKGNTDEEEFIPEGLLLGAKNTQTLIMARSPKSLYDRFFVKFTEDKAARDTGHDVYEGNLKQIFFHRASKEFTDPKHDLFHVSANEEHVMLINPKSPNLNHFEFLGRIIALALINNRIIEITFAKPVYKLILGRPVERPDLKFIDPNIHSFLEEILNRTDLVETLNRKMPTNRPDPFTNDPSAHYVPVTELNKVQYADLVCEWLIKTRIQRQIDAIRRGLFDVIPESAFEMFSDEQFELIVSGDAIIDVSVWKEHVLFRDDIGGYFDNRDLLHTWFWKCIESWPNEMRAKLLFFVTGSARFPLGYWCIYVTQHRYRNELPTGSGRTYGYFLDLPAVTSYRDLVEKLEQAITWNKRNNDKLNVMM